MFVCTTIYGIKQTNLELNIFRVAFRVMVEGNTYFSIFLSKTTSWKYIQMYHILQ